MTQIDKVGLQRILDALAVLMLENKESLCALDAEMGDGDLGLTMSKAFPAAAKEAHESPEEDLGKLLARCGMKMNAAAPSTMGTLMSSGFVFAGKALVGKTVLDRADFSKLYRLFADGAANRGKASRGERTVLDSLYPAAEAAETAFADGGDFAAIAEAAVVGAHAGLEATRDMEPKYGKAAVFAGQLQGKIDQGAQAGVLLIEGIRNGVTGK